MEEGKKNEGKPSKLRQAIPQICAGIAECFVLLALGSILGYITIVIAALKKDDSDIIAAESEIPWMSSVFTIFTSIGCLISGPILSIFLDSKRIMQLAMIPYIFVWLIFYYSKTVTSLYVAFSLAGLTGGMFAALTSNYIAEITQPHLRGIFLSFLSTSVLTGIFFQFLTGLFTNWRTASLISLVYPILGFISLSFVPKSPYWLAEKGRIEDAEKALCWLRGWVSPSQVQKELNMIRETSQNSADDEDNKDTKRKLWVEFTKREFIRPFGLVAFCFFIISFGGTTIVRYYSTQFFHAIKSPMKENFDTVFLGLSELIGTIVCVLSIHFTGKRIITFLSIGGIILCYSGSTACIYSIELDFIDGNNFSWIPTALLISGGFFSCIGIKCLPWILLGEIFSSKMKSIATGALVALYYFFEAVSAGISMNIFDFVGVFGLLLIYTGVNVIGLIGLYFMLPETESRSLHEIKLHYNGTRSLKDKSRAKE